MNRVKGLEGLRGYLAIWVWLTHVTTMATLPLDKYSGWGRILANGDTAVGIFIIISGFVITMNIDRSRDGYRQYIIRRGFRLFPAYLIALLISIIILNYSIQVLVDIPWSGPRTDNRIKYLTDSVTHFWPHLGLHVFLLHGLVPDKLLPSTSYAFIGQAWSLTLEWQFYLVAPLLFILAKKLPFKILPTVAIFAALLLLPTYFTQSSFLPKNLYLFYVGYLSYYAYSNSRQDASNDTKRLISLLLLVIAAMSMVHWRLGFGVELWCIFFWLMFFTQGYAHQLIKWMVTNSVSNWLGAISYSFYCIHMAVLFVVSGVLIHVIEVESRALFAVLLIGTSLPIGIGAAAILHYWVENPAINLGRRLAAKLSTPAPPPSLQAEENKN